MMLIDGQEVSRSDFMKELWADPEYAKRQSDAHKGNPSGMKNKHHKEESNEKNRQAHLGKTFTPEWHDNHHAGIERSKSEGRSSGRKGRIPWNKGLKGVQTCWNKGLTKETSEGLARLSEKLTGRIISQEQRLLASITNTGKKATKETCELLSRIKVRTWKELSEEKRNEWIVNIHRANQIAPNRPESLLKMILHEYHPTCKYTGDFSVMINGKNPDFVNEETKQVIELFGDYWHDGEDPTDRAEIFAQAGYETCVIWENELQNLDHVIFKLNQFLRI